VRLLVEVEPGRAEEVKRALRALGVRIVRQALNYVSVEAPPQLTARIEAIPGVVRVVEERVYRIATIPVEAKLEQFIRLGGPANPVALAWATAMGLRKDRWPTSQSRLALGAGAADRMGITGRGVKVAVLDTGWDDVIPAQKLRVAYRDSTLEGDPTPIDFNGHGSHVATTIAGPRFPTPWGPIEGVAKGVEIATIKTLGYGIGTARTVDVIEAIVNAYAWGAKVVNMSLGSSIKPGERHDTRTCPLCSLINSLSERGIIFIVAAGNSSRGYASCPGVAENAVTVAAVGKDLRVAGFSSREHPDYLERMKPDVAAPGVDIGASSTGLIASMEWIDGPGVAFISGTCLRGDTLVFTNPGVKPISQCSPGDLVYVVNLETGKLETRRVKALIPNGVKPIYRLKTTSREIYATDNHPFLAVEIGEFSERHDLYRKAMELRNLDGEWRSGKGYRIRKVAKLGKRRIARILGVPKSTVELWLKGGKPRKSVRLVWKPLKELRKGDLIVVVRELPHAEQTVFGEDFCRLFGFLLGDGWLVNNKSRRPNWQVCMARSSDEWINEEYTKLFERVFGKKMKLEKKRRWYYCYSKDIWLKLDALGLNKPAKEKEVPEWVFKLSKSEKMAFLAGLIDADGTLTKSGAGYAITLELASEKLVKGVKALCTQLGISCSNIYARERVVRAPNSKQSTKHTFYQLKIESLNAFANYLKNPKWAEILNKKRRTGRTYRRIMTKLNLDPQYFTLERIKEIEYAVLEHVYDIEVEDAHNFIANGIVVHNSMATPHCTGLVALWVEYLRRVGVEPDYEVVKEIIRRYGGSWNSEVGYGVPRFEWAVRFYEEVLR